MISAKFRLIHLVLAVSVCALFAYFAVVHEDRIELSTFDLSTRTIRVKKLLGTDIVLAKAESRTEANDLSKYLRNAGFLSASASPLDYPYIGITTATSYTWPESLGLYSQLYSDLRTFDDDTSWPEWSYNHQDVANEFWPLLLCLLRHQQLDDGKSIMLVKDVKAGDTTIQEIRQLASQFCHDQTGSTQQVLPDQERADRTGHQ